MRSFLFAALSVAAGIWAAPAAAGDAPKPKLVVAVSVDQFSADLFGQYRRHFTGGLARLANGVVYSSGYQSHAATETCPGHATILTGVRPARSGIIANNWFDLRAARADKNIYCAEDERVPGTSSEKYEVSTVHLKVPTLGDHMKRADPRSRVAAVAGKDRTAVMMGGHDVDQRWWWSGSAFTGPGTSPAAARANHRVAEALARAQDPLPLPAPCVARRRAVAIDGGDRQVGAGQFGRAAGNVKVFRASPELDQATLDLASGLRREMRLGEGEASDLLIVGLAATDYVGHTFGNQGSEMCLHLLALDQALGEFFQELDRTGLDYLVMLTADHGGQDIPERNREHGITEAARVDPSLSFETVGKRLKEKFRLKSSPLHGELASGDMYVDPTLKPRLRRKVIAEAVRIYRAHRDVAAVLTADEIAAAPQPVGPPDRWTLMDRAKASFDRERSGDFLVMLRPRIVAYLDTKNYLASHGSPWDYDRRVPILFWRKGMAPFDQMLAVETVDIMPTLAVLLKLPIPPGTIDGRCLDLDEGPESSCR
ncbi:alkaline phosphatase family protein [Sphingosinicella rhizophila]|uniref:Alkaline phosphatase family protein n=1 Tax=Sphingosinicella rhizophila TaxID=3050082 RepID=A0ABU3Q9S2_9SPHN|nr:alkaline phosphatase family protein [Sphingosinicella sp. GR2756]MDT9600156.1 alkaline phosphatase family protein [Sphingosinicella sp. GR2756]